MTNQNNHPWENYPHIWKTKSAYMSWLRGGIRRGLWERNPVKLEFIQKNREQIPNSSKRKGAKPFIWGGRCSICDGLFKSYDLEVDHKVGNHSLLDLSDLLTFIESIVMVTEDDLQLVCKHCHSCKSYAEKHGLSFDDAKIKKEIIAVSKMKVADISKWLKKEGIIPQKTKTQMVEQVRQVIHDKHK